MNEEKKQVSAVAPIQSDPQLKSYYCPHCMKLIMKGNVKRLSMTCTHCSKQIDADEEELIKKESDFLE